MFTTSVKYWNQMKEMNILTFFPSGGRHEMPHIPHPSASPQILLAAIRQKWNESPEKETDMKEGREEIWKWARH